MRLAENPFAPRIRFVTMILTSNYDELINLAKKAHEKYKPIEHEFRTPYFNEKTKTLLTQNETVPRKKLDKLTEELLSLNYGNLTFDTRFCEEHYSNMLKSTVSAASYSNSSLLYLSQADHYTMRLNANGTGMFNANHETFDLRNIESPFLFFAHKLIELQVLEAMIYADCDNSILEMTEYSSDIECVLDDLSVFDSRFICLRGWGRIIKKTATVECEKFIILNGLSRKYIYRTAVEERADVFNVHGVINTGYACVIDMKELALNFKNSISFELGILYENKLYYNTLAHLTVKQLL